MVLGGAMGTGVRYLVSSVTPAWSGVPMGTFAVNVLGAFLLALLLERLVRRGNDTGWSRRWRLTIGTGLLGGFTTYSALAVDSATLLRGHPGPAIGYAVGTVAIGAAASAAGILLSRARRRRGDGDAKAAA